MISFRIDWFDLLAVQGTLKNLFQDLPGGPVIKNLPAAQETWVRSLHKEDPLEKGMATHSSIIAWEITWTEEPGGVLG